MGSETSSHEKEEEIATQPVLPEELWESEIFPRLRRSHWPSAINFRRVCRTFARIYARWFTPEELCRSSTRNYLVGHLRGREIYAPEDQLDDNYICTYSPFAGPLAICVQNLDRSTYNDEMYFGYGINGSLVLPLISTQFSVRIPPMCRLWFYSAFVQELVCSLELKRVVNLAEYHSKWLELTLINPVDIQRPVCSIRFNTSKTFDVRFAHSEPATYAFPPPLQCDKEQRGSAVASLTARALRVLADLVRRGKLNVGFHWEDCDTILYYEQVFHPGRFDCAYHLTEMHKYFDAFPEEHVDDDIDDNYDSDTTETLSFEEE